MCEIQKSKVISCQLNFITIGDAEYNKNIEFVLELIKKSGLHCNIGEMSTIIKGDSDKVFFLLNKICSEMQNKKFIMNISISNICGCR
jgi:uncharacterized protein YqgV (UPF0045/DUF77 family)